MKMSVKFAARVDQLEVIPSQRFPVHAPIVCPKYLMFLTFFLSRFFCKRCMDFIGVISSISFPFFVCFKSEVLFCDLCRMNPNIERAQFVDESGNLLKSDIQKELNSQVVIEGFVSCFKLFEFKCLLVF